MSLVKGSDKTLCRVCPQATVCMLANRLAFQNSTKELSYKLPSAVVVASLRAQLQSMSGARLATPALHFNADCAVDATRAVAVAWVPTMAGAAFVVGHASGYVYLYHKVHRQPAQKQARTALSLIG